MDCKTGKIVLWTLFIVSIFIGIMHWNGVAHSADYTLGAPDEYEVSYETDWFQVDDNEDQLAMGVCYGPFYEVKNKKGKKVAGLFSACGFYGKSSDGNLKESYTGAVQVFELFGLVHGTVGGNQDGKTVFGWGFSIDKLWEMVPDLRK